VLARLKERDVPVIDADDIVHELLGPGTAATDAIASGFGREFLRPDGSIDRALLGAKVFGDPGTRRQLEAILHPIVYKSIRTWFDTLDASIGVASIPLLYETGREGHFDFVVVTTCPPDVQLQRVLERAGMSEDEARQRIAAQMPLQEKAARANFVILTGGTKQATDRQVDELLMTLQRLTQPA
jgi:dephospho-CoA kinase